MRKIIMDEWTTKLLEEVRGKKVYVNLVSVNASGMSRKMKFYVVIDGEIRNVTHPIAGVLGYTITNDESMRVPGCGMDMAFSVLSNLNYAMARKDTGKTLEELLKTKECGERIYDNYFIDADRYGRV